MTFLNRHPLYGGGKTIPWLIPDGKTAVALSVARAFPFVTSDAPPTPITYRQTAYGTNTSGTTLAVSFPHKTTSGNLLIARAATNDPTITVDTAGWTSAVSNDNVADGDTCGIWYRVADGSETTVQISTAGNTKYLHIMECPGLEVSSPLDKTATGPVTTSVSTQNCGTTGTLSVANELLVTVLAIRADATAESAASPFTMDQLGDGTFSALFSSFVSSATTTQTPSFSWTTAGTAWGCTATFKALTVNVTSTANESITFTDSQTSDGSLFGVTRAETVTLTDAQTSTGSFGHTRDETVTLTDSQSVLLVTSGSIAETVTLTDSQSASLVMSGAVAESVTLTDSQSVTSVLSNARAESVTLTDSQSSNVVMSTAVTETVTLTDSQDASVTSGAGNALCDETITFTDSQSTSASFAVSRAESVTLTDAVSATGSFGHVVAESVTFTAAQTGTVPTAGVDNVDEIITFTAAQTVLRTLTGTVSDTVSFFDNYESSISTMNPAVLASNARRPLTRDRLMEIFGDHRAIKAFEQLDRDFAKLDDLIDGDGMMYGAKQRYGQGPDSAAQGNDSRFRKTFYNASLRPQLIPASVRTYIDGSDLTFYDGLRIKAHLTWRFTITKTAAGVATSIFDICFGDTATTLDIARVSFTKPAGTAVADEALIEIFCTIEEVGSSGLVTATFKLSHDGVVGHATTPLVIRSGSSVAFNMSNVTKAGVCITSGTADEITITNCQSKAEGIT